MHTQRPLLAVLHVVLSASGVRCLGGLRAPRAVGTDGSGSGVPCSRCKVPSDGGALPRRPAARPAAIDRDGSCSAARTAALSCTACIALREKL